jgi:predicted methyltransferase
MIRTLALSATAILLAACASDKGPQTLTPQQIAEVVASPDRSAADRATDERRKPAEMLAFIGITPGINALDISAAGGYTTELIARAIGPRGTVYGQSQPVDPMRAAPRPAVPEGDAAPAAATTAMSAAAAATTMTPPPAAPAPVRRTSPESLNARNEAMRNAHASAALIVPVIEPFDNPIPKQHSLGGLDLVTLMFNYHDFGFMGVDRAAMNRAVFKALKPGGLYVIADHAGRPGTGISESGTLHRMEEAFLKQEVEAAGFQLAAEGNFLRNPNDPKDRNTPEPPQPKDEFVVKFVKPLAK